MKFKKILLYILILIMLIGGLMGIIKALVPNMMWLSFRNLLGYGLISQRSTPVYVIVYGIVMAILEIIASLLLLAKVKGGILFAYITLCINACVCIVAIFFGDLLAIASLLLRLVGIYILHINQKAIKYVNN